MSEHIPQLSLFEVPEAYRDRDWYRALFEERLAKQPLATHTYFPSWQKEFIEGDEPFSVIKSADAILYGHIGDNGTIHRFDIILSEQPGASEMSHNMTLKSLGLKHNEHHALKGFIFLASNSNKYLLLRKFNHDMLSRHSAEMNTPDYTDKILEALENFSINAAISDEDAIRKSLEPFIISLDSDNSVTELPEFDIERKLWDGYTTKIAQFNGWTNRELLRFRVAGEWPEKNLSDDI